MKNTLRPILIFFIGNIIGIIYALLTYKNHSHFELPEIDYTFKMMVDTFIVIFLNNTFVLSLAIFTIPCIFYVKNLLLKDKVVYSKADSILYHILNGVILFRTGNVAGFGTMTFSIDTSNSFFELYAKAIIPHGVIEMIPFMIAFHLNYLLIKNKQWNKPFPFKIKTLLFLELLILLAAIIESTITPLILF